MTNTNAALIAQINALVAKAPASCKREIAYSAACAVNSIKEHNNAMLARDFIRAALWA